MDNSLVVTSVYKKIRRYCSYQDRTQHEVCRRLRVWGVVDTKVIMQLVQLLRQERFIDDVRYIEAFIRGKLRYSYWGREKIYAALVHKRLPSELIRRGLDAIPTEDYSHNMHYLFERKQKDLQALDPVRRRQKLIHYLLQKGYEGNLVQQLVGSIH